MRKPVAWLLAAAMLMAGVARAGAEGHPLPKPNDKYVGNEHGHPLEGLYFPPESHHYQDLDTAPNDQLNRNVRILRTTNKAQLNRYVPVVYSLRNVNPMQVLRFIRRVVQMEEGAVFTFVSPEGNSGRVLVAIPEYQVPYMNDLIKRIDKPGLTSSDGTKRIYRQLKHRRANIDPSDSTLDDSAFINAFSVYLTDNYSKIIVDPEQNAVFIEDTPSGSVYLDNALTVSLDLPTPQVVLNTKIYEIDASNNARIGLDYIAWKNGPGANLLAFGAYNEVGSTTLREGTTAILDNSNGIGAIPNRGGLPRSNLKGDLRSNGYNLSYRYELNSAFFDFLAVKGKARILNSAKVAALNTRPATITAGDQVLYYRVSTTDPSPIRAPFDKFGSNKGRTVIGTTQTVADDGSLTPVETGLTLSLTPLIYENGVDVAVDGKFTDYNGFDDTGAPRINSRDIKTSLRMNVGEETVLGGLLRESVIKGNQKAPLFGRIPVLGYLAGQENTRRTKTEVVVAVKAESIVRYDGKGYGVGADDAAVIKQGDGSAAIQEPKPVFGFDQFGLDSEK